MSPEEFWVAKFNAPSGFDVAVGGDSRVIRGVAPQEMAEVLGSHRVINFGFQGTGLSRDYLARLRQVLRREGERCIVLSVTPYSLTAQAQAKNGFQSIAAKQGLIARISGRADRLFAPVSLPDLIGHALNPAMINTVSSHYYENGWIETDVERAIADGSSKTYGMLFKNNEVTAGAVEVVVEFVAAAAADSVRVMGVRMPVSRELREVEDRDSQMDWPAFVRAFEAAGGHWLVLEGDEPYATYDGSHLTAPEARRFSRNLALSMWRVLFGEGRASST
jgi:hypothetical protein